MFIHSDKLTLGVDIGGSHVTAAWVNITRGSVLEDTLCTSPIDPGGSPREVVRGWAGTIRAALEKRPGCCPLGIGIAMPGPFDYDRGVSLIDGVHKFERLMGLDIRLALKDELETDLPFVFRNDAACFGVGESLTGKGAGFRRVIALTLGTGLGSAFVLDGQVCSEGPGVPTDGFLYAVPFRDGIAEDYVSSRWLVSAYAARTGRRVADVRELAALGDRDALEVFGDFGRQLAEVVAPWIRDFDADCLVIGGSIRKAAPLFLPSLEAGLHLPIHLSDQMERAALVGAAALLQQGRALTVAPWRKTLQPLLPFHANAPVSGAYDLYPFHHLEGGTIAGGFDSLAAWMASHRKVLVDGYAGQDWDVFKAHLGAAFRALGKKVAWYETRSFQKPEKDVLAMTAPFMGEPGSVWGRITHLALEDFYQMDILRKVRAEEEGYDLSVCLGIGAALVSWDAPVVYVDLPKNEIQYRMRAGSTVNLGLSTPGEYKRYYFVDWVVLNRHRARIKDRIAVVADGQWRDDITWTTGEAIRESLRQMTTTPLRVRPWFEAGAWGGQWLKAHVPELPQEEVNYAWSFELIVPENGLVFESAGYLLEIAFDWLMEQESASVLGRDAERFGTEFPIRFDFLDTFDGGNLSIQCHPSLSYIQEQFGERITQDETYYILDCTPDAGVYLGFQEDIDPGSFREVLETSNDTGTEVDIERYVQRHPAHRHDLFLIPNGTIHSSGKNNLVLEISATPYIYTFKMYDWLRLDLDGKPRPINIAHAFQNLHFERKGDKVRQELLSRPLVLEEREDYRLVHLPTHPDHFYDVHRLEFCKEITITTGNQCHVLMLVEGNALWVWTPMGEKKRFHFAETFVLPAAAGSYMLQAEGDAPIKVVKAFIK
ncbi:ROK family protein [Dinghuibacter silviterrae]|uniref:Putative NBD/HSP70 family sugar kinase n=1 Tax=Dinghuibacter silviterrae TaxID=1539049 RepID=A0A4R8DEF9_9BACT|nr:ROK family protein [Dinghuibacter silviterrae]TDW95933.1 putative NBD/HSP70 family sugar kinase [Dinghuibacter silviterrae]